MQHLENVEAVKILLGRDKTLVNEQSGVDGWTPLEDATLKSNIDIIKILISKFKITNEIFILKIIHDIIFLR